MYKTGNYNANTSPLLTYNTWNNLTYTLHIPLRHRILHANTQLKSLIRCLFMLIKSKCWYTVNFATSSNSPFLHLFVLIIPGIIPHIGHTPLKRYILYLKHANTLCKFYQSKPLHTNTANFATSSNLQEILLANKLIICEIITHIRHTHTTQTSYFMPKTC